MISNFLQELRRREVFKVAIAYVLVAWGVLEAGALIFDTLQLPPWSGRLLLALLVLCFPIALIFSWVYQVDSQGIRREQDAQADGAEEADEDSRPLADDLSIAVLPFDDLGVDQSHAYIGEGVAEGILNLLARVPELRVVARTSSFAFRGQGKTVAEIARELGVAYVLEGSLRKSEDTLRVVAQLIRADDDSHLYSDSYDVTQKNLLRLEDEIAEKVSSKLRVTLLRHDARELGAAASESHDLYLQGSQMLWSGRLSELRGAIEVLTRATEMDPEHANAHALLSYAHMLSCSDPQADRMLESALPKIEHYASRAMELDRDSEQVNLGMAMYKMAVKDWEASERYFLRA
ncbi:MAG: hypothetical protein V2I82_13280, partial [Halieaceae bacterium]|nr:hypothetical protein [Halieaceae bacterium]